MLSGHSAVQEIKHLWKFTSGFIELQILNFERSLSLSPGPESNFVPPCKYLLGGPERNIRILQHIILSSIVKHLDKYTIFTDDQNDLTKKDLCKSQFIITTLDLAKWIDSRGQLDVILLDFSDNIRQSAATPVNHDHAPARVRCHAREHPQLN